MLSRGGACAVLTALFLLLTGAGVSVGEGDRRGRSEEANPVTVVRVVDGDTVVVLRGGREETVRLLGVDAPERGRDGRRGEPYSLVATRFLRDALARAESIGLEVAGDGRDVHGRTLGFLWVRDPGETEPANLSEELLRAGLARAIRFFEYPGKPLFLRLEEEAKSAGRGLWAR